MDSATGITVELRDNLEVRVSDITNKAEAQSVLEWYRFEAGIPKGIFIINLLDDGVSVRPKDEVTIRIPCTHKDAKVYLVQAEYWPWYMYTTYEDGCLVFTTDRCAAFVVTYEEDEYVFGDVDFDGNVEIRDATWNQRSVADIEIPFTISKKTADIDGDGNITVMDATAIQYYLANMKNPYNVGKTVS